MFHDRPRARCPGIGTDIVEIDRVRRAVERSGRRFLERVFTPAEIAYCGARKDCYASLAARFAAKEAVIKALGGLKGGRWVEVEVRRNEVGCPEILLHGTAAARAREIGIARVLISLSHSRDYALAFAMATGGEV